MKRILSLIAIVAIFILSGCEKETEGVVTGTVFYPVFVNSGSQINVVGLGESFSVPEVAVYDGEKDITTNATITGVDDVDLNTPGYYEINYTATTGDGYSGTYSVLIFIYDPDFKEAVITGKYQGVYGGVRKGGVVKVTNYQKGVYYCEDMYGGYYSVWVADNYGEAYRGNISPGYFIYVGSDTFIIRGATSGFFGPFQDDGGVDWNPETGVLSYYGGEVSGGVVDTYGGLFTLTPVEE